ncbi:MAG TPA: LLM class flavin-dependent oxidoreductase [Chloroflexota bacterium]|nr:LLM class flavin-dependent oxidoreductase [Chloroflexota bacterium]
MDIELGRLGVSFSLRQLHDFEETERLTLLAEQLGFDSVWIPEAWGRDSFTVLAALAMKTRNIRLATGIVNVFSRTPALVAQSIASLDDISGGRAILGLGASGPRVVERWHGLQFENVLQRTREFVEVVRAVLAGGPVTYHGQIFRISDFSLGFKPPRSRIPIFLAALGPANVRLTAEIADGWLPIFASSRLLSQAAPWIEEGVERARRRREDVAVASYIPTLIGSSADDVLRRHLAFYIGAMGSYYYRLMVRSGWEREARAARDLWRAGSRLEATAAITDDMLRSTTIGGTPSEARRRLEIFRRDGVSLPILAIPGGAPSPAIRATLEALGTG